MVERDPSSNQYALRVAEIRNLLSLRELRGRDIVVKRDARIEMSLGAILEGTVEVDAGGAMSLEYTIDADGVVVPGDMHTLHALSLYKNLDRTAELLREQGHVQSKPLPAFYMPRYDNVILGDGRVQFTDNAAYLFVAHAFLVMPSFMVSELPLMLNEGVVAHEYAHAVIHQELFGDATSIPHQNDTASEWVIAQRHLLAMHEGVADLVGFAATGDPDYIAASVDVDRDISEHTDFVQQDLDAMDAPPPKSLEDVFETALSFDPHHQGSLLARAIHEGWADPSPEAERKRLIALTLAALRQLKYEPGTFTLASFPNELVRQVSAAERPKLCGTLRRRFAPMVVRFTACEGIL